MKTFIIFVISILLCAPSYAYDLPYVGEIRTIETHYDDTLSYLARDYNLGYVELISANPGVDPWMPGDGTTLILPDRHILPDAPHKGIVINLPEMRLYAYLDEGLEPVTFPLGIGREGLETPTGQTTIMRKVAGPTWRPTARMREEDPTLPAFIGPGADNPLGTHALYLGWPEYLIHGTNRPFGIGRRVSSGCIRMYPEAITRLFTLIPTGTPVNVVNQPIKAAWIDDTLYMEAHTNMTQSIQREEGQPMTPAPLTEEEKTYIRTLAGDKADQLDWDKITELVERRNGIPTPVLTSVTEQKEPPIQKEADTNQPPSDEKLETVENTVSTFSLNE